MPRGDRTGPAGQGPMSGRGLGYCAGYSSAGFTRGYGAGMGWGGGMGRGRGFGRGYGYGYYRDIPEQPAAVTEQNIDSLKNEAKNLSERLNAILNSIEKLTKKE